MICVVYNYVVHERGKGRGGRGGGRNMTLKRIISKIRLILASKVTVYLTVIMFTT
jgi:hypothetical protein